MGKKGFFICLSILCCYTNLLSMRKVQSTCSVVRDKKRRKKQKRLSFFLVQRKKLRALWDQKFRFTKNHNRVCDNIGASRVNYKISSDVNDIIEVLKEMIKRIKEYKLYIFGSYEEGTEFADEMKKLFAETKIKEDGQALLLLEEMIRAGNSDSIILRQIMEIGHKIECKYSDIKSVYRQARKFLG